MAGAWEWSDKKSQAFDLAFLFYPIQRQCLLSHFFKRSFSKFFMLFYNILLHDCQTISVVDVSSVNKIKTCNNAFGYKFVLYQFVNTVYESSFRNTFFSSSDSNS